MAIQDDNTVLCKGDLKAYHEKILPYLGGNFMLGTNVSDYYSTDEKIIGVWTDGKPVYQKVIIDNYGGTGWSGAHDHSISNIETVIYAFVTCTNSNYTRTSGYNSSNIGVGVEVTPTKYEVFCNYSGLSTRTNIIIVQYTKTTDVANSAVTTPGCYDINFPNTWPANQEIFFGNGLYGQRFTGGITIGANTLSMFSLISDGVNQLINCGGNWYHGSEYVSLNGTNHGYQDSGLVIGNKALSLRTFTNQARNNAPYNIWATYTKA